LPGYVPSKGIKIVAMTRSLALQVLCLLALFCVGALAQAPESQLPDAPQQQPSAQQPPPPDESPQPEKPESKIKRTLKRGAPNCVHVGGLEKCKPSSSDEDETAGEQTGPQQPPVPSSHRIPRSSEAGESSSKESQLPPMPGSESGDVQELHPYNPHKADKNVEVGDFYFKRGNYRAAESRYAEALLYMSNHATATYKLAEAQEKLAKTAEARKNYEKYLKILPQGEYAEPAKKALTRLDAQAKETPPTSPPAQKRR
jgi:tetratricopeptide (TPR) repeat protein